MGISQAGLAFRAHAPIADLTSVLSALFAQDVTEVDSPVARRFDIRNHGDVMVQTFADVCFVSNADLVWNVLKDPTFDARRLHRALGRPQTLLAFCQLDSGRSHGYALFERGERRRTRLQAADLPALVDSGTPQPFEQRWLNAAHYLDDDAGKIYYLGEREVLVHEDRLTARMLADGLEVLFGVCPWETLMTPTYRFFSLDAGQPELPQTSTPTKRPWWHFMRDPGKRG